MPSAASGAFGSGRMLYGALRDVRGDSGERRRLMLCGRKEPLDDLVEALGAAGSPAVQLVAVRRLQTEDAGRLSKAAVVVYGGEVLNGLDAATRTDLEVLGRVKAPKIALLEALDLPSDAVAEAGRIRGLTPADLMPYRRGRFPVERTMRRLADRLQGDGPWLASQLPALRPSIIEELTERAARRNAKAALLIFVPGADLPVLTAVQMRLVLSIAACYGQEISADRALELLSVLGAAFGFRAVARSMLDFVPIAGWAVQSAIAYSATRAIGAAADEYFARGAVADASKMRQLAAGLRFEIQEQLRKRGRD